MEDTALRNRLSVLWLSGYAAALTTIVLELLSGAKTGVAITQGYLFALSIITLIGPIMAFLSQVLKTGTNRGANMIAGIVTAVIAVIVMLQELETVPAITADPALGVVFAVLVVWYAWKSKPNEIT